MFCTIPIVHFCTLAFASYTVDSDVFLIFGVQIAYLNFYTTFYSHKVFPYIILLTAIFTFFYLLRKPYKFTLKWKKNLFKPYSK